MNTFQNISCFVSVLDLLNIGSFCSSHLGWLIFCLNLTGLREVQTAGQTLFLGAFVRVSAGEMSI